jgi:hypothetical protein
VAFLWQFRCLGSATVNRTQPTKHWVVPMTWVDLTGHALMFLGLTSLGLLVLIGGFHALAFAVEQRRLDRCRRDDINAWLAATRPDRDRRYAQWDAADRHHQLRRTGARA